MEDLRKVNSVSPIKDLIGKEANLKDQMALMFTDWVRLFHHPSCTDRAQLKHVNLLISHGILQSDDVACMFFRVCTIQGVEMYAKTQSGFGPPSYAFQGLDAYARLIVLLILQCNDSKNTVAARLNLSTKILSVLMLVLVHYHEMRARDNEEAEFNQLPFFRLFSVLLNDLSSYQASLGPGVYAQMLSSIRFDHMICLPCIATFCTVAIRLCCLDLPLHGFI